MGNLTVKQEKFVQGLVAGLSQREAYKQAYPTSKSWKEESVDQKASVLIRNVKVMSRYRELLKEQSNMFLWSREQAFNEYEWLKNKAKNDIANNGIKIANSSAFKDALEGMNNMAFKDLELADKKLLAEIERVHLENEKISKQIKPSETTEDKVAELMAKIVEVHKDGNE